MSDYKAAEIAFAVIIISMVIGGVWCNKQETDAFARCVEAGGAPVECKEAMR